jgi:hypothetical protein
MKISEYYPAMRAKKAELLEQHPSGYLYISPIAGGAAIEVNIENGARPIVLGTHRESTAAEIELLHQRAKENILMSQAQELRTQGLVNLKAGKNPSGLPAISIG